MIVHGRNTNVAAVGVRNDNGFLCVIKEAGFLCDVDNFLRSNLVGVLITNAGVAHARQVVRNHVIFFGQKRCNKSHAAGVR